MSNFNDRVMEVVDPHLIEIRERFRELADTSTGNVVDDARNPAANGVPGIKPEIDRIEKMLTQLLKDNSDDDEDGDSDKSLDELTNALWDITNVKDINGIGDFWDKLLKALVATVHSLFGDNELNIEVAPGKFKFLSQVLSSGLDPRAKTLAILSGLLAGPLAHANTKKSKERQRTLQALFNMITAMQNNEAIDRVSGLLLKIENEVNQGRSKSAHDSSVLHKQLSMMQPQKQASQLLSVMTDLNAVKAEVGSVRRLLQQRFQDQTPSMS